MENFKKFIAGLAVLAVIATGLHILSKPEVAHAQEKSSIKHFDDRSSLRQYEQIVCVEGQKIWMFYVVDTYERTGGLTSEIIGTCDLE